MEAVNYGARLAGMLNVPVKAVVLGDCTDASLLGQYGAQAVIHVNDSRLNHFDSKAYSFALCEIAQSEQAHIVVCSGSITGRAFAPRVAARRNAALVSGAVSLPDLSQGFTVKKAVFAGKAFSYVQLLSEQKVIVLTPNSFPVEKMGDACSVLVQSITFRDQDFSIRVQSQNKVSGTVPLSEAELVVSGGRGMKGPENWGILEEMATTLGATLACSRPVADSHWRPHHEHVGQTGGTIRPNLYIAVGISGAIQHLAGVNSSKTIVVINKDPEAPFFKAADYGVLGDAFEIVPKLNEAFKRFKATQSAS
ncbi:MAG TPA: electron transfer flavoprotein subunit alpha/FixB family protein [Chitinophagaceae bacterium]|nr:electron transfer flavoprotein subunit alpha/FixB family protein [Chitinophagaceae bacterium]